MIGLTCRGCGRAGRVPDRLAGRRVVCKLCRAGNLVPEPDTPEVYVARWLGAIDPASESATVEVEARDWSAAPA